MDCEEHSRTEGLIRDARYNKKSRVKKIYRVIIYRDKVFSARKYQYSFLFHF
jgi:hypothetical protein